MKGCKDCEERERNMYEAQMAAVNYVPGIEYIDPQNMNTLVYKDFERYCSICGKKSSLLIDRDYGIEYTYFLKHKDREWLNFKDICSNCSNYISCATAEDVVSLHKQLSKKNNPLKKKWWGKK